MHIEGVASLRRREREDLGIFQVVEQRGAYDFTEILGAVSSVCMMASLRGTELVSPI